MENENENNDSLNVDNDAIVIDENDDIAAVKEKFEKLSERGVKTSDDNKQLFERAKKAEGFVKTDGKWVKAPKTEPKAEPKVETKTPSESKTNELDENALDFLDLKGITEDEDVTVVEDIVAKTGQTVRQVLKDDYVISKLKANKDAREVKAATPGSTKRGGATGDTLEIALAKYETTGEYSDDFELRSKVINKLEEKSSTSVPGYKKESFRKNSFG